MDVAVSSLLTHHLTDARIVEFLRLDGERCKGADGLLMIFIAKLRLITCFARMARVVNLYPLRRMMARVVDSAEFLGW